MKTRIETTSPKRTRQRLQAAGLDPAKYTIGPTPGDFTDATLGDLIRRDAEADYWKKHERTFGCQGCGSETRYRY